MHFYLTIIPAELQQEEETFPEERKLEECKLETSAEILQPKNQREFIHMVQKPQPQELVVQNIECVLNQALEPILASIPPLAPTQSVLATADPVSLVLGAVVASYEPTQLVPEQQMDNLARSDGMVRERERGKERAEKSREEETQERRAVSKQVTGFKTPDSIKEIQCEDQDGINTQQVQSYQSVLSLLLIILIRIFLNIPFSSTGSSVDRTN